MLERFDAIPPIPGPGGEEVSLESRDGRARVRNGWLRGQWSKEALWPSMDSPADAMRRLLAAGIERNMRAVLAIPEGRVDAP